MTAIYDSQTLAGSSVFDAQQYTGTGSAVVATPSAVTGSFNLAGASAALNPRHLVATPGSVSATCSIGSVSAVLNSRFVIAVPPALSAGFGAGPVSAVLHRQLLAATPLPIGAGFSIALATASLQWPAIDKSVAVRWEVAALVAKAVSIRWRLGDAEMIMPLHMLVVPGNQRLYGN